VIQRNLANPLSFEAGEPFSAALRVRHGFGGFGRTGSQGLSDAKPCGLNEATCNDPHVRSSILAHAESQRRRVQASDPAFAGRARRASDLRVSASPRDTF